MTATGVSANFSSAPSRYPPAYFKNVKKSRSSKLSFAKNTKTSRHSSENLRSGKRICAKIGR